MFFDPAGAEEEIDLAKRQGWKKQEELQKGKVKVSVTIYPPRTLRRSSGI